MLSKNQIKLITQLKQKKCRLQHGFFVAEGVKTINELLNSKFELYHLYTTSTFNIDVKYETLITEKELKKVSFLKSPNQALAVFKIPKSRPINKAKLMIALDGVRDPGNLGTIIRLCDWFGVSDLLCSIDTVDCYNPKVVQATMGSISRVNINYVDLEEYIRNTTLKTFGAFMEGDNVYHEKLPDSGILILGNEANGISDSIQALVDSKISIPRFGNLRKTESLNVANATAILLSEFKRRTIEK